MPERASIPKTTKKKDAALPDLTKAPSNGPTREDGLFMLGQWISAQKQIDLANANKRRVRSRAKNMGINLKQFDAAVAEREHEDGTTLTNFEDFQTYTSWFGLPISKQIKLMDALEAATSVGDKAFDDGYQIGIMNLEPDWQAYPKGTQESELHLQGIDKGKKVLHEKSVIHAAQLIHMEEDEAKLKAKRKAAKKGSAADDLIDDIADKDDEDE